MNYIKYLTISLLLLILSACGTSPTKFTADGTGIIKAQRVDSMSLENVEWKVIRSKEELKQIIEMEEDNYPLYVLIQEQHIKLSSNVIETIRYIKDQRATILYYENMIDRIDNKEEE